MCSGFCCCVRPAGHLPGQEPWHPSGSFDFMIEVLERRVTAMGDARVPRAEVFEGERLEVWVQAVRLRYKKGALSVARARRLEALDGWQWAAR